MIQSIAGIAVFIGLAWAMGENRHRVRWRRVGIGVAVQIAVAFILLRLPAARGVFIALNEVFFALRDATRAGTAFVFGFLGGGPAPYEPLSPQHGFILAFQALPLVLVVSALSALLFYWKVLPLIVRGFSYALERTLGLGGAEGLGVSANVFFGMVESPLFIRPYLAEMTRSELFTLMTCGMATIAGTVLVLYAGILDPVIPNVMGHILTASIISVPAAITISRVMIPETGPATDGRLVSPEVYNSGIDAVTKGTLAGVELLINIVAMLVVLVALVHLVNLALAPLPDLGGGPLTLQRLLGWLMAPVVWLMGIPWAEAVTAGELMGTKTVLNELIAYVEMSRLPAGALSPESLLIMTYALCGFANPGSLGIMIGGMGTMAPSRRDEIVALGLRSVVAGTLATCTTGAVVGAIQ